ncbi:Magnetosome protein MamD [Azospirillaceae bacterium]
MLQEIVLAKVEDTAQAAMLSGLTGKSFTVAQVTTAGNGLGTFVFLNPDGGVTAAGQGAVALKLEGTRQMAQMSGLIGKSVTIGKAPMMVGGVGKWIAFCPNAGLAAKGLVGAGAAGLGAGGAAAGLGAGSVASSQLIMLKLEGAGAAAQTSMMAGKTFSVAKVSAATGEAGKWLFLQPIGDAAGAAKDIIALKVQNGAGQLSWLVGKTFTVGNGPMVAADGAGKYLFLQPATGAVVKGVAGTAIAAKGAGAAGLMEGTASGLAPAMKLAALKTAGVGTAKVGATVAAVNATQSVAASAAKGVSAGGTIWTGSGLSLGLGLGLGAAGPLLLGALVAAAGYGIYKYRSNQSSVDDRDEDLAEALS